MAAVAGQQRRLLIEDGNSCQIAVPIYADITNVEAKSGGVRKASTSHSGVGIA